MQINPHFLFNSLNTIYGLSLKKSDNAPKAVLKLSQLLRYMIDENGQDKVPLEQEVTYLNNYIEMQRMRSSPSLSVQFDVIGMYRLRLYRAYVAIALCRKFLQIWHEQ
jgi:LytS/YehU family sensor histidine kinase